MTKTLSATRKGDRAAMAAQLKQAAEANGAEVSISDLSSMWLNPHSIGVLITAARGAYINFRIDGRRPHKRANTFVGTWNLPFGSDARFSHAMGMINTYHRQKATVVAYGFEQLLAQMVDHIKLLASGDGFEE